MTMVIDDSLPEEKLQKVKLQCLDLYQSPQVSILHLTKVLGHLTYIVALTYLKKMGGVLRTRK